MSLFFKSTHLSLSVVFCFCCQLGFVMNGFCDTSSKYFVALNTQSESTYSSGLGMKLPAENPNDKFYKLRGVEQTGLLTNRVRGVSQRSFCEEI